MWIKEFKIAVIENNIENIKTLLEEIPDFDNLEDMKEAAYLLQEAATLFESLKEKTSVSIQSIKNSLSFLESTQNAKISTIDIMS